MIEWQQTYEAARERSLAEKKPIFLWLFSPT